jgi:hypothetical protein
MLLKYVCFYSKLLSYEGRVLWTSQAFPCSPYILFIFLIICSHPESYNQYIYIDSTYDKLIHLILCHISGDIYVLILRP